MLLPGALLALVLAAQVWFLRGRSRGAAGRYRRWLIRAPLAMLVPALVALAALGRLDALWRFPPEFMGLRALLPAMEASAVAIGSLAGVTGGLAIIALRARFGRPLPAALRRMMPAPGERGWAALVAAMAGVVEEPLYRLVLPLLVTMLGGSALAGFAAASIVFARAHRYQGIRGMALSGSFGLVLAGLYVLSGQLWLVVVLHALNNAGALVVWPAVAGARGAASTTAVRPE
ncbi:CPBP family intramembrane glutamic endopeptidase [Sphingomonas carotinifaciens]|uniref:CAAX protease self-immunity n=1 Tax=Sphingomonas carotinifaciens TaxID=1166323 RepID=A0A1G7FQL4_9SPHN|nr:CPBP family intramembrane glutamic endopeptidase [Sphingomonas carotinifaciens]MBB4086188.1 membrane protease YdiL (CAAX protease family) [Sphingomonas carotinifaciens]MWC42511.1 CPBP family intramembrane metalloprotease [Sphingomonas carotinifaciens]SDE78144.1 CAAX protease self-immunity [Sphingomonas carotinifaciens]